MGVRPMSIRKDKKERKYSEDYPKEAEYGLERIMGYTISGIGFFLILLKLMNSY